MNCFGVLEFRKEILCKRDVLDQCFISELAGYNVTYFVPAPSEAFDDKGFDELLAPKGFGSFKKEWGHVYRRPEILAGVKCVGILADLDEATISNVFSTVTEWKLKLEGIFTLMMHNLLVEQEPIIIEKTNDGGINTHTGLYLAMIKGKKICEVHNPHSGPPIIMHFINEKCCLSFEQFKAGLAMASSEAPISHTYILLLAAYNAFSKGDFRSSVVLGGSSVENCILQTILRYVNTHGISIKLPIGELGKKFVKLKELGISIPVENYKTSILDIRNHVIHKGIEVSEKEASTFLNNCRTMIEQYEPGIIGYDEKTE